MERLQRASWRVCGSTRVPVTGAREDYGQLKARFRNSALARLCVGPVIVKPWVILDAMIDEKDNKPSAKPLPPFPVAKDKPSPDALLTAKETAEFRHSRLDNSPIRQENDK